MKTKFTLLNFLIVAILLMLSTQLKAQANSQDSIVLVDLYNSTNGPNWYNHTNWLTKKPLGTWYGVTVTDNRVTELIVGGNNLKGQIPESIGNLTAAVFVTLSNDSIYGTLPATLGNLASVQYLNINFTKISGSIPSSIGNLSNLIDMELQANSLTGTIPSSVSNLTKLQTINLTQNQLSGNIPLSVFNIPSLAVLQLGTNQFSGPIPNAIGRLKKLVILHLEHNQLSGALPDSLFSLTVLELYISSNKLSGKIPASIGNLQSVQDLYMQDNQFSGPIPASIGNLTSTEVIDLSLNKLSGNLPLSIKNLKGAGSLNFSYNYLTITPDIIYDPSWLPLLRNLDFRTNRFTFNGVESIAQNFPYKFTYSPQASIAVHQHGNKLAVSAGGTLSNNTYAWYKAGAGNTVINGDSTFQPATSGNYFAKIKNAIAVKLTLTTDTFNYTIPLATNDVAEANKTNTGSFNIYPNPVKDNVLHVQANGVNIVTIINASGRVFLSKQINGDAVINLASLANGLYFIKINNYGETKQFQIQH